MCAYAHVCAYANSRSCMHMHTQTRACSFTRAGVHCICVFAYVCVCVCISSCDSDSIRSGTHASANEAALLFRQHSAHIMQRPKQRRRISSLCVGLDHQEYPSSIPQCVRSMRSGPIIDSLEVRESDFSNNFAKDEFNSRADSINEQKQWKPKIQFMSRFNSTAII